LRSPDRRVANRSSWFISYLSCKLDLLLPLNVRQALEKYVQQELN